MKHQKERHPRLRQFCALVFEWKKPKDKNKKNILKSDDSEEEDTLYIERDALIESKIKRENRQISW